MTDTWHLYEKKTNFIKSLIIYLSAHLCKVVKIWLPAGSDASHPPTLYHSPGEVVLCPGQSKEKHIHISKAVLKVNDVTM